MILFPLTNEDTITFLNRRGGGRAMILLNVMIDGTRTSVCENTRGNGAWRSRHDKTVRGKLIDYHDVKICPDTVSLTAPDATKLAEALPVISDRLSSDEGVVLPIGNIRREDPQMLEALKGLEASVEDIRSSVDIDLSTDLFVLRRDLRKSTSLHASGGLTKYAENLLRVFRTSQERYAALPELRKFVGEKRSTGIPSDRGGRIRKWIADMGQLRLPTDDTLTFVEYETKPLRVSQILNWQCSTHSNTKADPRRDSIDAFLSFSRSPVITEIKAAGDSFCSSALVQVIYYGCALANARQRRRLTRQFPEFSNTNSWLCVIAESRDESLSSEDGFQEDEKMTLRFLSNTAVQKTLAPTFKGVFLIIVKQVPDGPDYTIERSHRIRFSSSTGAERLDE